MKITNNTIEEIINVMNDPNSFRNNVGIKIPAKIRYAIRVNEEKINGLYSAYQKERAQTIQDHIAQDHATIEDNKYHIKPEFIDEVNNELMELASIQNDVSFHMVDKETMEGFLDTVDLSVPEEKILLLFVE